MMGGNDQRAALDFDHGQQRDVRFAGAGGQYDHAAVAVLLPGFDALGLVRVRVRWRLQL
jgi:hypothetical protein